MGMSRFGERRNKKSDAPKWVRYLGLAGKTAAILSLVVMAVFVVFAMRNQDEIVEIPRWLSVPLIVIPCIMLLIACVSAVGECVLMCKEKGMKALRPVFLSFLIFYIIFLIYNFFASPSSIHYLQWLCASILVTVGSCTWNFWHRK
jgi:uncharacterized membrane protein YhdT